MKPGSISVPISVLLASVVLHIVIPGILAFLFSLFFLLLSVGEIIVFIAESLMLFLLLQLTNTLAGSGIFAFLSVQLMNAMNSWWKYPFVLVLSCVIHFAVFGTVILVYWLLVHSDKLVWIVQYGWKITAITAPSIAVIAITAYLLTPNRRNAKALFNGPQNFER